MDEWMRGWMSGWRVVAAQYVTSNDVKGAEDGT